MATILFMRDAFLTIKLASGTAVEYQGDVSAAAVTVTAGDVQEYPTLDGNIATNVSPETYALDLTVGQDWSAAGLARFLWENAGQTADFVLNAHGKSLTTPTDSQPEVSGQVTIVPATYGGTVGEFAEAEVSLPCKAKPTLNTGTP